MKYFKVLINAILAGIAISFGGWFCLRTTASLNSVAGAFIFSFGLILICNFGFYLYTGKICYLFDDLTKIKENIIFLLLGILGNLIGTMFVGLILNLIVKENNLVVFNNLEVSLNNKLNYDWYQMIMLGFFCGILVYIAVEGFKTITSSVGKYIVLMIAIGGFIISGFEHSVANMFYFFLAGNLSLEAFFSIFLCLVGNSIGGLFIPLLRSLVIGK